MMAQKLPESKNEVVDSLNDSSWLTDLAFLADVTQKHNILKLQFLDRDDHAT
jgi:hypothetical protein